MPADLDYRPAAVVALALTAHLDAFGTSEGAAHRGPTGRQVLQRVMGLEHASRVTEHLRTSTPPDKLIEAVTAAERSGLVPHGHVTGLARQVLLTGDSPRPTVAGLWWPRLRDRLGLAHGTAEFRDPIDVLVAAEAFCDYHYELITRPPNSLRESMSAVDRASLEILLREVSRFAVGPYGVAEESYRLVARMATLAPEIVGEELRRNAYSTQLVRSLESAVRHFHVNSVLWRTFTTTLESPPTLASRVYWLRALRRLLVKDRERRTEPEPRGWVISQLKIALRGEHSYSESGAVERRFALWCLAEFVVKDSEWRAIVTVAEQNAATADLVHLCKEFRGTRPQDANGFRFTPTQGWPRPREVTEVLNASRSKERGWSMKDAWAPFLPATRERLVAMLEDALLAPSVVRQRAATDLLRVSGEQCRSAVATTVERVLTAEMGSNPQRPDLSERCLRVLGSMGRAQSIPVVERVIQEESTPDSVLTAAVSAAGDLANRHPERAIGLMSWAADAISKSESVSRSVVGIRAVTAFGRNPRHYIDRLPHVDDLAVIACLDWSEEVLADPRRPEPGRHASPSSAAR